MHALSVSKLGLPYCIILGGWGGGQFCSVILSSVSFSEFCPNQLL